MGNQQVTERRKPSADSYHEERRMEQPGMRSPVSNPSGGYIHPSGGYNHPSGGYNHPSGGYTHPTGGYINASGAYINTSGGYNHPTGGYTYQSSSPNYSRDLTGMQPWSHPVSDTHNIKPQIDGHVITDSMRGVDVQSPQHFYEEVDVSHLDIGTCVDVQSPQHFYEEVDALMYSQPLIIHTKVLPPGVALDDPRLPFARTINERTYVTDKPIFPAPSFTATIHPSLLPPHEPACRLVSTGI